MKDWENFPIIFDFALDSYSAFVHHLLNAYRMSNKMEGVKDGNKENVIK